MRNTAKIDNEYRLLKPKLQELLGSKCFYCNSVATQYHHIIPRHQGGDNRLKNIVPICDDCHNKAHSKRSYRPHGKWGRKRLETPANFNEVANKYLSGSISFGKALHETGLKKNTFYRMLKQYRSLTGDYRDHRENGIVFDEYSNISKEEV